MQRFVLSVATVVVVSVAVLVYGVMKFGRFSLVDTPEDDLAARYRLVCGAYADLKLDIKRLPAALQPLAPLASRYGHSNTTLQDDCARKLPIDEATRIVAQIDRNRSDIEHWLAQFPEHFNANEVQAFRRLLVFRQRLRLPATANKNAT